MLRGEVEELVRFCGVFLSGGWVGDFVRAVEFDLRGSRDVVVQRVGPVVEGDAGDEGGGAEGEVVGVHGVEGFLEHLEGFDLLQGRFGRGVEHLDGSREALVESVHAGFFEEPEVGFRVAGTHVLKEGFAALAGVAFCGVVLEDGGVVVRDDVGEADEGVVIA